jgi:MFS family permease
VGIGPLPGGLLATHWGLAAPFLAYAVTSLVASAVAWLAIPETRAARRADEPAPAEVPYRAQLRLLTAHRGFLLVSAIAFVNAVARTGALFNIIPILARDRLALHPDRIGFGLALASIVGLVVAYPTGVLADRHGRKIIIVPATILSGLSLVLFLLAPTYAWFLAACAVWSVAMGISGAAPAAYAADTAPPGMNATAVSTYRMLADLGYVVGPIALGLAADLAGIDATRWAPPRSCWSRWRCSSPATRLARTALAPLLAAAANEYATLRPVAALQSGAPAGPCAEGQRSRGRYCVPRSGRSPAGAPRS